ncbi:hypothetical protein RI129_010635 [Pyrocoelia pectoralis]|uniref:Methyltransferase type 11 domain-containing protein n=1 Tax=Pyrocoelia pectoralis TaxID=417401 RepID=A0AAN7V9M2_9COLE
MFKPFKFAQNVGPSLGMIQYALNNYWKFENIKEHCNVLEVGCGPGNTTHDYLLGLFPKTLQTYIGIDKSKPMVEYAQKHYQNDPRLKFKLMDITTDSLPNNFLQAFDHVLSFQCLQFVSDHRKSLSNIYRMTKPGGNTFFTLPVRSVLFDVYEELAQNDIWKPYLKDYRKFLTPTQFFVDPQPQLHFETILKEVGFSTVVCVSFDQNVVLPKKLFFAFVDSVCVYPIPKDLMDNFLEEVFEGMKRRKCVNDNNQDEQYVTTPCNFLIAYAIKPHLNSLAANSL